MPTGGTPQPSLPPMMLMCGISLSGGTGGIDTLNKGGSIPGMCAVTAESPTCWGIGPTLEDRVAEAAAPGTADGTKRNGSGELGRSEDLDGVITGILAIACAGSPTGAKYPVVLCVETDADCLCLGAEGERTWDVPVVRLPHVETDTECLCLGTEGERAWDVPVVRLPHVRNGAFGLGDRALKARALDEHTMPLGTSPTMLHLGAEGERIWDALVVRLPHARNDVFGLGDRALKDRALDERPKLLGTSPPVLAHPATRDPTTRIAFGTCCTP